MASVYKPREVDLNLFVNSASKGFNDGAKVPDAFSSFVDAFSKGIDQNYKNEQEAAQTEKINIENEQAPVIAKINEAKAIKAEADAKVIKDNPDLYAQSQIAELKSQAAEKERTALIDTQKTDLLNIWNGTDPIAKAQALNSGKFATIFGLDPNLKKQYAASVLTDPAVMKGAPDEVKTYWDSVHAQNTKDWTQSVMEEATKQNEKNNADLISNPEMQQIQQMIQAPAAGAEGPANQVSFPDLLTKGRIVGVPIPHQIPDPSGAKDEFGNVKFITDTTPPLPGAAVKYDTKKVFQYEGKQYDLGGTGISSDTDKTFNNARTTYTLLNQQNPGQYYGDIKNTASKNQSAAAKADADAQAEYQKTAAETQSAQASFNESAGVPTARINPQYQAAADAVNKRSATPVATASATPVETQTVIPDLTVPYATKETPVTPQGIKTSTPLPTLPATGTPAPILTQGFTITPGTASPIAQPNTTPFSTATATNTPSGSSPAATPGPLSPQAQQAQLLKQIGDSKAAAIAEKYQKTNTPVSTPVTQAAEITKSSFVPPSMKVNVNYHPQHEAIQAVAKRPELQNFSAMAKAVAVQESGGNPNAVSETGNKNLMQITKPTLKDISPDLDVNNSFDSAYGGAIYIEKALQKPAYSDNPMLALTSYNGGDLVVAKAIKLAGSTEWGAVKDKLLEASYDPAVQAGWIRDGLKGKNLKDKPAIVKAYAEKVVANFPSFVYKPDDMLLADKLKQQKVLTY